ncbi:MAG: rhodanese-like domain-containing protein [Caldilineales bacterium]|nr:rhodanese-like domain-containing protein [Caldilineales bacterium]MDW8318908.1 rhodanese-like domain-containing protein [Anaerolineae bacterium]
MTRPRTRATALLALLLAALVAVGCGGPATTPASSQPPAAVANSSGAALNLPATVDVRTVDSIRTREDVFIVDVREPHEYAAGHVPGAVLIPLGQLSSRLSEIPKDKTVVAVCRSGNRSGQATELLRQRGFDAHNMQGGMNAWTQAGLPIEK